MNIRIGLVAACCFVSILLGFVISRSNSGDAPSTQRNYPLIGLSMDTLKEERWLTDRDIFLKRAEELGAKVEVQSANSNDSVQIQNIESLISLKVDAMVIIPHDGTAMARGVTLCKEAGIPVIAYDRLITDSDLDLYLTFDNVRVGEIQAQYLVDQLNPGQTMRIIRIYGSPSDNNAKLFKQGQDNVLAPYIASGQIVVIHEDWAADWNPENAKKIADAAITKNGTDFHAILASNDGTAGGAIQVLIEEGIAGDIIVTGQDADQAACQRIARGSQAMTVYKPIKELASSAAELAVQLAKHEVVYAPNLINNGQKNVPAKFLAVTVVTKSNIRETVIADDFHSEADVYGK